MVEVCAASVEVALAAQRAGADRIELNVGLELDGLTPTPGLVKHVLEVVEIPVIAMVRPRGGHFVYSDSEWSIMMEDARWLLEAGAAGLAFGCLQSDGQLNLSQLAQLCDLASDSQLVMHRAFDELSDPKSAMDRLAEMGVCRVMSSGQSEKAIEGSDHLSHLVDGAPKGIQVLPASGIGEENVLELVQKTGVLQIHGTFGTADLEDQESMESRIRAVIDLVRSVSPGNAIDPV